MNLRFRGPVAVWMSILLLSGLFLLGQDAWPPCSDLDGDGYGSPADASCRFDKEDCCDDPSDDPEGCEGCTCDQDICLACARCIHPGMEEALYEDTMCGDGRDNDCDQFSDKADPGCSYQGGTYRVFLEDASQSPRGCFVPGALLLLVEELVKNVALLMDLPAYSLEPFTWLLSLPYVGDVPLTARFSHNDLVLEAQGFQGIDMGTVPHMSDLGLNCAVTGVVEGSIFDLNQDSPGATLIFHEIFIERGSGDGACTLPQPDPECFVELDLRAEGPPWVH